MQAFQKIILLMTKFSNLHTQGGQSQQVVLLSCRISIHNQKYLRGKLNKGGGGAPYLHLVWWAEQESGPRLSSPPAMNEGAVQEGLAFLSAAPCQLMQLLEF